MGNGMQGTRGIITRILGDLLGESLRRVRGMFTFQHSGECSRRFWGMFKKTPGNAQEDFGECSRKFWGILLKIPGNAREDSGECSRRFRGMFKKIPGNPNFDLFLEILLVFYQILLLSCYKTIEKKLLSNSSKKKFS